MEQTKAVTEHFRPQSPTKLTFSACVAPVNTCPTFRFLTLSAKGKFVGDAPDFLHGPADQFLMIVILGLFGVVTSLAR